MKSEEQKHRPTKEYRDKAATWAKDSHGLFDYESTHVIRKVLKLNAPCVLIRAGNDVKSVSEQELSSCDGLSETVRLMSISMSRECQACSCAKTDLYDEERHDKLWLSIRGPVGEDKKTSQRTHRLERGDIIRLGRVRFKLRDYRIESRKEEKMESGEGGPIDINVYDEVPKDESEQCRICYYNTNTPENPLLAPCKCTGSVKFIHYNCIKLWLDHHLTRKSSPCQNSYYWKSFECEICRTAYPFCLSHKGNKYYLIDIVTPPSGDYMVIETLNRDKHAARTIHVLSPAADKDAFKLGRGHDADVRIADISVSRVHAFLRITGDGCFVEDNSSKFGTLLLLRKEIALDADVPRWLQVGRTLLWCCARPQQGVLKESAGDSASAIAGTGEAQVEDENEEDEHPVIIPVDPAQMAQPEPQPHEEPVLPHSHQPYSTGNIGAGHFHPPLS